MGCSHSKAVPQSMELPHSQDLTGRTLPSVEEAVEGRTAIVAASTKHTPFQNWMKNINGGKTTTLQQQFQLALDLYQEAYPNTDQQLTAEEVINMVENTPIHDTSSIVTWTGINVDWFLNVFCKSPFMKVLLEYGCEVWYIRKICVIEMVRQTAESLKSQEQPNGTFVKNIHSVVKAWDLESGRDITAKPTTFISYTGAYTIQHVVDVLAKLDPQEYIWMDIFCVNQFAWTGKGRTPQMKQFRNTFMDDLQQQIQAIGNTALILEKWDNAMLTLGQMWVLWEIFNTAQANVNLSVLLTQEQRDSFIHNCLESKKEFENIRRSLSAINANNAVTDDDVDRQFILERMQREDNNLVQVNTSILDVMRNWLAEEGLEHLSKNQRNGEQPSGTLLNNLGSLLQDQGNFKGAEPLYREALAMRRKVLGDHHPNTLTSISNLALLLQSQGNLNEAGSLYREALNNSRQVLGDDHPDTLTFMSNLGGLLQHQGNLNEAEPLYREALGTRQKVLGDRHPDTLSSLNGLGALLQAQGKLDEAEPLLRESMIASTEVLGDRHPSTLTFISNLGGLLQAQGKLNEAESSYREALEIRRQVLGDSHPSTLTSISHLGSLLKARGNLNEAEPLLREALETSRQVLGDHHPNTLTFISNFGSLLQDQGNLIEAEPLYREALKTSRNVLGDLHPNTLTFMSNLGSLLQDNGRLNEAEPLLREALETSRQVMGDSHPDTLPCINNLGLLMLDQGNLKEAEPLLREALETSRQVMGDHHPDTLPCINNLALLLQDQGMLNKAEPLLREALETKQQVLGDHHPDTLISMHNLAQLFLAQPAKPHLEEARSLLLDAVAISLETLGIDHEITESCLVMAVWKGGFLKFEGGGLITRPATL